MKKLAIILIFVLIGVYKQVYAQGPPILTDSPILLGLDGGGVRTFVNYSKFKDGTMIIQPIAIPYNIFSKLQVGIIQPVILSMNFNNINKFGLGNLSFFTKLQVLQYNKKNETFRGLIKLVQSFKTGKISVSPSYSESQIHFVTGYISTRIGIYATIGYSYVSNDLSDYLIYNFSMGFPLLPQVYPPFQLNFFIELQGRQTTEINKNLITVSPGIQLIVSNTFLFESNFQIPTVNSYNQFEYAGLLGIRYLFF